MRLSLRNKPEWVLRAIIALLAAGLGMVCLLPIGNSLVLWSYDLPFIFRSPLRSEEAIIVYLDAQSVQELKTDPQERWPRALHAQLLERLAQEKAKAVVYDIEFFEEWPDQAIDLRFAKAMRAHGNVVLASSNEPAGQPGHATGLKVFRPIPLFAEAASRFGAIQVDRDPDMAVRKHLEEGSSDIHQSLAWAAASSVAAKITKDSDYRRVERWVNYYGPPDFLPSVSFWRALSTNLIPSGHFRDKVVFVGSQSMTGLTGAERDESATPYTRWTRTKNFSTGVEIQATMFLNLLRGDWLRRLPGPLEAVILGLTGLLLGYGLTLLRPLPALALALITALAVALLAVLSVWQTRFWFPWLIILAAQLPVALFGSVLFHYFQLSVQQRLLEQSLQFHLAPARVKEIMARPDLLKPGAVERRISILFSDIANFSKVTERMVPEDLVHLLNNYFEATLACIYKADGTVVQLIGDAIYAIWNAPLDQTDHQERVCRAALDMREQLVKFDTTERRLPLRTRIGLHTGSAYVGNFGSTKRFEFTAIGQSVNLASRLEGLNKYLGTEILATRVLQTGVENKIVSRLVGYFRFKGFDHVAEVYELIGTLECETITRPWRKVFEEALYHFQRRDFDLAEKGFNQTLELHPEDGPAKFYLDELVEVRAKPPGRDWTGEVNMKEK